jgi:hypothetical protein
MRRAAGKVLHLCRRRPRRHCRVGDLRPLPSTHAPPPGVMQGVLVPRRDTHRVLLLLRHVEKVRKG